MLVASGQCMTSRSPPTPCSHVGSPRAVLMKVTATCSGVNRVFCCQSKFSHWHVGTYSAIVHVSSKCNDPWTELHVGADEVMREASGPPPAGTPASGACVSLHTAQQWAVQAAQTAQQRRGTRSGCSRHCSPALQSSPGATLPVLSHGTANQCPASQILLETAAYLRVISSAPSIVLSGYVVRASVAMRCCA